MSAELLALGAQAAQTIVAAASADAWEATRNAIAGLLGRGDANRTGLASRRLDETKAQLNPQTRSQLESAWQTRFVDFLEDHPEAVAELRALLGSTVAAVGHSVTAGGNVSISAATGGFAAGTIQGNVTLNPTMPGPAGS